MFFAALLGVTLVPVLMMLFIRGKITPEAKNPVNRFLIWAYQPFVHFVLRFRWLTLIVALLIMAVTVYPFITSWARNSCRRSTKATSFHAHRRARHVHRGSDADSANSGPDPARNFPKWNRVFGKAGQAETPTDPAPLSMFETVVQAQAAGAMASGHDVGKNHRGDEREDQNARHGEHFLDAHPDPHRNAHHRLPFRTGHQGFRPGPGKIQDVGVQIEKALTDFPNTRSVFAERTTGGYFLDFTPNREVAARYGLTVGDVNDIIETAIGGKTIATTVEGRERYPISVRYARDFREDLDAFKRVLVPVADAIAIGNRPATESTWRKFPSRCWPTSVTKPARLPSAMRTANWSASFSWTSPAKTFGLRAMQPRKRIKRNRQISARLLHPMGRPIRVSQERRSSD